MTDRELLELAAKAAGYDLRWSMIHQCMWEHTGLYWNPLEDDGDALRLAVKLSLSVFTGGFGAAAVTGWIVKDANAEVINIQEHYDDNDALAATRRAIVRAAAEIGRSMP